MHRLTYSTTRRDTMRHRTARRIAPHCIALCRIAVQRIAAHRITALGSHREVGPERRGHKAGQRASEPLRASSVSTHRTPAWALHTRTYP